MGPFTVVGWVQTSSVVTHEVEFLAHNLKSVIGFFNADAAYQLAKQLEIAAREGEVEKGRDVFLLLEGELSQVRESLMAT